MKILLILLMLFSANVYSASDNVYLVNTTDQTVTYINSERVSLLTANNYATNLKHQQELLQLSNDQLNNTYQGRLLMISAFLSSYEAKSIIHVSLAVFLFIASNIVLFMIDKRLRMREYESIDGYLWIIFEVVISLITIAISFVY